METELAAWGGSSHFEGTAGSDEGVNQSLYNDSMRELEFKNGVNEALRWYVSDAAFQADVPNVRKQLSALKRAIEWFNAQLPSETTALGHFLSKTYAGTCFLRSERQPTERQLIALEEHWRDRVGLVALKDTLSTALRNVEAAQILLGTAKPLDIERGCLCEGSRTFGTTQSDAGPRAAEILLSGRG